jgi:hypothetical protein
VIFKSLTVIAAVSAVLAASPAAYASGNPTIKGPRVVSVGNNAIWTKKCNNGTELSGWLETFDFSSYEFLKKEPSFQRTRYFGIQPRGSEQPAVLGSCNDGSQTRYNIDIVPRPTLTVTPASVYQGKEFDAKIFCPVPGTVPELSSPLWPTPETPGRIAGEYYTAHIHVGAKQKPRKYKITLKCIARDAQLAKATAVVRVLFTRPPVTYPPQTTIVIETGFGGMAAEVARHHPTA